GLDLPAGDPGEGDVLTGVVALELDTVVVDVDDPAPSQAGRGPQLDEAPGGAAEVPRLGEGPVDPGGGHLEGVGAREDVDVVERGGDRPRDVGEELGVDTTGAVGKIDDDAHDAAASGRARGDVLEEERGLRDDRLQHSAQTVRDVRGPG